MYTDTITLFNFHKSTNCWYATVLEGVDLNTDKATIVTDRGAQSTDETALHVKYSEIDGVVMVGDKPCLNPKEWAQKDDPKNTITFARGNKAAFFIEGKWDGANPVNDNDYTDGFWNYMNSHYDAVYSINSVARYSVIPHFEIAAK